MTQQDILKVTQLLTMLIEQYPSMREFSREIREDVADVSRWRAGAKMVTTRGVLAICRKHPEILPFMLNPDIFPQDLRFKFEKGRNNVK
jgi:Lhr-like helicase